MSQSKIEATRSGSAGSNWQLSSLRSLWTVETRLATGTSRLKRSCSASMAPGESSKRARAQRFAQPLSWRCTKPSGLPRSPSPQATGSSACSSAIASTSAKAMRRPASAWPRIEGGNAVRTTSPRRRSITKKSLPSTA